MTVSSIAQAKATRSQSDLDALKAHACILKETMRVLAEMRREDYLAHREQGFTEAQALELVKHDADLLFRG